MRTESLYRILKRRFLIYVFIIITIIIGIILTISLKGLNRVNEAESQAVIGVINKQLVSIIEQEVEELKSISKYYLNDEMELFQQFYDTGFKEFGFARVEILDANGIIIDSIPYDETRIGFDMSYSEGFIKAEKDKFIVGNMVFDSSLGENVLVNTLGYNDIVVVGYYRTKSIEAMLTNLEISNGYMGIVDQLGDYIAHTNYIYVEERRRNEHIKEIGSSIYNGDVVEYEGDKYRIRYQDVDNYSMKILYYQDNSAVTVSIQIAVLLIVVILIIIYPILRITIKLIVKRLENAFVQLVEATNQIAAGNYQVDVNNVGYKEMLPLIASFKSMSEGVESREEEIINLNREREKDFYMTISLMAKAIEAKDQYTGNHCDRVRDLAILMGKKLNLSEKDMKDLRYGSILHDIGKIGIDERVLNKPGRLTDEEFAIIKQHPKIGFDILKEIPILKNANDIIKYHHESYDGKGYPEGLKGNEIPYLARIVTIVDAFDAMTSKRPYREFIMSSNTAVEELIRCSGTQFDADLVEVFKTVIWRDKD